MELKIYKIRMHYVVERIVGFPRFGGPTIRGLLGHALKNTDEDLFNSLFATSADGGKQKPYAINAAEYHRLIYLPGDTFYFDIILFSEMKDRFSMQAFIDLGKFPIGQYRGKLSFLRAENILTDSVNEIFSLKEARAFKLKNEKKITNSLSVKFRSPVCIKNVNGPGDITFLNIIKRIYERINKLELAEKEIPLPDYDQAGDIKIVNSNLIQYDVKHYSKERKKYIHYKPAFTGTIEFYGNFKAFDELLQAGEHIQIGRGTTSGLGKFEISYA